MNKIFRLLYLLIGVIMCFIVMILSCLFVGCLGFVTAITEYYTELQNKGIFNKLYNDILSYCKK